MGRKLLSVIICLLLASPLGTALAMAPAPDASPYQFAAPMPACCCLAACACGEGAPCQVQADSPGPSLECLAASSVRLGPPAPAGLAWTPPLDRAGAGRGEPMPAPLRPPETPLYLRHASLLI